MTQTRETDIVQVEDTGIGFVAVCREHGDVALKQTEDDAHLAAARHLARVHIGTGSAAWREWDEI